MGERELIGSIIVVIGGIIGAILDLYFEVKEPTVFFLVGTLTGMISLIPIVIKR